MSSGESRESAQPRTLANGVCVVEVSQHRGEAAQRGGDGGVVRVVDRLADLERALQQGSGGGGLTEVVEHQGEIAQPDGEGGLAGLVAGVVDPQGTFEQGSRFG